LFLLSAKVGIEESRLRIFREAEITGKVTATCRRISRSEPDPFLIELQRDNVAYFSRHFELSAQSVIAISGVYVKLLIAAALFRARGIVDQNQMACDSNTRMSAAKAMILNGDLLLFRRVIPQMPPANLAELFLFAATTGRKAFIFKELPDRSPVPAGRRSSGGDSGPRTAIDVTASILGPACSIWLDDNFIPRYNAKSVLIRRDFLVLDKTILGKHNTVDKIIIDKCLQGRVPDSIKQIRAFDHLKVWKRHDNWTLLKWDEIMKLELLDRIGLWSGVEVVDFSRSSLTLIGEASFVSSKKLVKVVLPDTVIEIQKRAFRGSASLKAVKVGKGLTTLGEEAFCKCGLVEIVLPDTLVRIEACAFDSCASLKVAKIGKGLKTLGKWSFNKCGSLNDITLPPLLTEMETCAFGDCTSLKTVKFGRRLKTLGGVAFHNCGGLIQIILPDTVTEVGNSAFDGCTSVKIVKLGKGLKTLGDFAFYKCESLIEIVLPDTISQVGKGVFNDCGSLKTISLGKVAGSLQLAEWDIPASATLIFRA
jgi:hypothetical protein